MLPQESTWRGNWYAGENGSAHAQYEERENGVYNFNLWVHTPPKDVLKGNRFQELQELDEEDVLDFQRRGVHLM